MAPFFTSPRVSAGSGRLRGRASFRAVAKMCECRRSSEGQPARLDFGESRRAAAELAIKM